MRSDEGCVAGDTWRVSNSCCVEAVERSKDLCLELLGSGTFCPSFDWYSVVLLLPPLDALQAVYQPHIPT